MIYDSIKRYDMSAYSFNTTFITMHYNYLCFKALRILLAESASPFAFGINITINNLYHIFIYLFKQSAMSIHLSHHSK
jgi:hypothetical protein